MSSDPLTNHNIKQTKQAAEVEQINEFLNSREIKDDLHWFTYRDTLERAFHREDRRLYYIDTESGGAIIGVLMVWCKSRVLTDKEAQIRLVAVSPEHRYSGYGSALCNQAESFARSQGQNLMIADVAMESDAVSFWKTIGYSETESWQTSNGRQMLRMEKSL